MVKHEVILVSACLTGLPTRYDGNIVAHPGCLEELENCFYIPVCPEQLGGLPTPRCPADIIGGDGNDVLDGQARVICRDGQEVTEPFIRGAEIVVAIAKRQRVDRIFLKSGSPSCGVAKLGVTAALLQRDGFEVREFG